MLEHTPEPWYTNTRGVIGSLHPEWRQPWAINLGDTGRRFTRELDEANARRVVACINALQGAATEELEQAVALGITDVSMGNLFSSRLRLQKQHDGLQTKYEKAVEALKNISGNSYVEEYSPDIAKRCLVEIGE